MRLDARSLTVALPLVLLSSLATPEATGSPCWQAEPSPWAESPSLFPCLPPAGADERAPSVPAAPTDIAYSKDFWNSRLGFHALNNFPGYTTVNPSVPDSVFATDFDPTATTLYALDTTSLQLGTYNLSTGSFAALGASVPTVGGHTLWSGLAVHPETGVIYASAIAGAVNVAYGLYTLHPTTGAPTLIGQDATSMGMIAIAINCAGQMYGHDILTDSIYSINPATGAVTLVGATGVAANFAQGMDFDNETGELYAWTYQGGGANQFGTINLTTGALTTLSSSNPIGEYEGAIQNSCATLIFEDGFESGDTSAWTTTVP